MASIELKNVIKRYGKGPGAVQAIHGVSAQIERGEFIVIVGPSGCGKSTLLRMVAGLEEISEGVIEIAGKVVNDLEPAERDIAMVFQNYALYPHMSVFDNMAYGLRIKKLSDADIKARVDKAAKILELSHLLTRRPGQLSGGQRQRVAMGRAIVREPQVFLFDEPLSNLDAKLRAQTRLEIQKLHREIGVTSLFVTHDQVEAMTLAQRMIVMNAGRVEQIGTPETVYERPASTFVASFIGAPPMNLIEGVMSGGRITLDVGAKSVDLPLPSGVAAPTQRVILGVRPEHFEFAPNGWSLPVEMVEMLGAERLIYGRLGEQLLIVRADADTPVPKVGERMSVLPQRGKIHWFDVNSKQRL